MKIKTVLRQHRRDMWLDLECEHCGEVEREVSGYDDHYYHSQLVPKMECKTCGKTASEDFRAVAPKYPDSLTV